MKLVLNSFFLFLFFLCKPIFSEEINKKYNIRVAGIKIGELDWKIKINETDYLNELNLESKGFLSGIYRFKGDYYSKGFIKNNELKPIKYSHFWKTNKTIKNMNLIFQNDKLVSISQTPVEKEHLRVDVYNDKKNKDPLTSFLQIVMGEKSSLVVDGRRVYKMKAILDNESNQTAVEILDYFNLWADHKRNKFEKVVFLKKNMELLPFEINIYFDGRVFKLEQN